MTSTTHPSWEADQLSPTRIGLVRHHLQEVIASHAFSGSKRAQDFLRLIVEHALAGEFDRLRERMIGAEMFGRPVGYDTANDSVVRVKATEVRRKLAQYYLEAEIARPVRIELPTGSYVPRFHFEPEVAESQTECAPFTSGAQGICDEQQRPGAGSATGLVGTFPISGQQSRPARPTSIAIGLGLILIAAAVSYLGFRRWFSSSTARPEIRSIAILPLQNLSGDPKQDYFADGMTEELIADLGQLSALRVISSTSTMSYKGTKKKLPEIARELGVEAVVEGSILREANQVRITAELIDARTDHHIWAHTYVRDLTSVLALQGEVAQAIADEISINEQPPEQHVRHPRVWPVNTEAEDLYLQGMLRLNAGDFTGATSYFQKAIDADPNFAQAHAALADCYGWTGEAGGLAYTEAFFKQKTEAARAIELDDSLPEGHAELANAAMNLSWDWATAAKEFHRALELNPSSAIVHQRYAVYLERTGKLPEAIAEVEQGIQFDPVSVRSFRDAGFTYYFSREFDQALGELRKAQERNINLHDDLFLLGDIDAEKGLYAKSISEFLRLGDSPHALGHLGNAYARAGQVHAALNTIRQLEKHVQKNGVGRYEIALVYAGLGDKDEAFAWLEESYKTHNEGLTNLKIDPCLDPLRSDPCFNDLVRRVGFSP